MFGPEWKRLESLRPMIGKGDTGSLFIFFDGGIGERINGS
jgi:hypothetical protein